MMNNEIFAELDELTDSITDFTLPDIGIEIIRTSDDEAEAI